MKAKVWVLAIMAALLMASCGTKQGAIDQLESFSYELRDNSRYYDAQQWERAGYKFLDIRKGIGKHEADYTAEEKAHIGQLEGKCATYMARGAKEGLIDRVKGVWNEVEGFLKGILNGVTE